jgi:putative DNA primase/helicase
MGGPTTTPTLTPEEATLIRRIFKTLDQTPTHAPTPANTTPTTTTTDNGTPPGQDYENKTTWHDILTPHGWTPINTQGTTTYWRRPGKNDGISATTGHAQDRERLYVFSTNTPFQAETPYTKFGAYTTLNHAGNHTNAAKQLAKEGYGTPTTRPITNIQEWQTRKPTTTTTAVTPQPENNGTTSLAPITPLPTPTIQTLAYTDDANALELIDTHGHTIRHAADQDRWYTWNGHTWQPQPASGGTVRELAKNIARNMPTTNKEETAWKKRTLSAPGITAILTQAATDPRTTTKTTNFDNNPYLLNTPQGTIDLRTSQTHEHNPLNYCTKTTTCHPQPGTPTKWLKFLADTFQQNPELITTCKP